MCYHLIHRLSCATTPGQSGPGSDGNKEVLRIPQSFSITGTLPSDCLVPYLGHSLRGFLLLCRFAVSVFNSPSRLGNVMELKSESTSKALNVNHQKRPN